MIARRFQNIAPLLLALSVLVFVSPCAAADPPAERPNIIMILTDDMGFSDLGCYGGEINTPNLDRLAQTGLRFSQFYNCGKCEPTRAAIVSGHQWWSWDPNVAVRKGSPNLGEVLQLAGYRTMMLGKWHADGVPFERGFHRHFGFMGGGTDFFLGDDSFTLDGQPWPVPKDFYVTSALSEQAVRFVQEEHNAHPDQPFFMYLAYNAPHSPIQALPEDLAKYRGKYLAGWDQLRAARFEKQQQIGLATAAWHLPPRPDNIPAWDSLDEKSRDFEDLRMATSAAMVDRVDQGIGRLIQALESLGVRQNTVIMFVNDNGASPNDRARRGDFGTPGCTWNTGVGWAHLSNTPMKFYKRTQHSGGVTTPFIVNWPAAVSPRAEFVDQPCHVTDLLPTLIDLAGAEYPLDFNQLQHPPLPGRSLVSIWTDNAVLPPRTMHFSLFNNMAVVHDGWRLVTAYGHPWELYDLTTDRTEVTDLSTARPDKLQEMLALQKAFYLRDDVRLRLSTGEREPEYAPIYREDGRIGPGSPERLENPELVDALNKLRSTGLLGTPEELAAVQPASDRPKPDRPKRGKARQAEDTENSAN